MNITKQELMSYSDTVAKFDIIGKEILKELDKAGHMAEAKFIKLAVDLTSTELYYWYGGSCCGSEDSWVSFPSDLLTAENPGEAVLVWYSLELQKQLNAKREAEEKERQLRMEEQDKRDQRDWERLKAKFGTQ